MQRSSSSIGGLAAALAKAQAELVNPEKSLVRSIQPDGPAGRNAFFAMHHFRRARYCSQDARPAQYCCSADDRGRSHRWDGKSHNGFGPCQWRMDRIGLASQCDQRDGHTASDGSGANLCAPLCAVHSCRHRR